MARGAGADDLTASLGSEVMRGPWGAAARQAVEDRRAIEGALAAVPATDRATLPEVLPTVDELVRRVLVIVPTLHHLDAVLTPNARAIAEHIDELLVGRLVQHVVPTVSLADEA